MDHLIQNHMGGFFGFFFKYWIWGYTFDLLKNLPK